MVRIQKAFGLMLVFVAAAGFLTATSSVKAQGTQMYCNGVWLPPGVQCNGNGGGYQQYQPQYQQQYQQQCVQAIVDGRPGCYDPRYLQQLQRQPQQQYQQQYYPQQTGMPVSGGGCVAWTERLGRAAGANRGNDARNTENGGLAGVLIGSFVCH